MRLFYLIHIIDVYVSHPDITDLKRTNKKHNFNTLSKFF